ncbi:TetR/AcrR family transcriptional regulator [Streptomyces sp. NPDC058001]|uniref:TetR/AcrR family transcriptional regulator n=1 Tax=Streptomyces sp. NPDC058001 TaxID=3346300 RepID=UPI0036E13D3E
MKENAIPSPRNDVTDRIARRALERRGAHYVSEVRGLLDAALDVMRARGTASRPRVADIVTAAGVSNETFYRHFPSKDALVAAILEDGTERLRGYVAHQMGKESAPQGKVRRWVEGILSQAADDDIAATTLAVLWNAGSVGEGFMSGPPSAGGALAPLLREPFAELGSIDPGLDASLAAHATFGTLTDHLWRRARPTDAHVDHVVAFCLRTVTAGRTPRNPDTDHD